VQAIHTGTAGPGTLAIALTLGPLIGWLLKQRARQQREAAATQ
jgi:hypothetical protein